MGLSQINCMQFYLSNEPIILAVTILKILFVEPKKLLKKYKRWRKNGIKHNL